MRNKWINVQVWGGIGSATLLQVQLIPVPTQDTSVEFTLAPIVQQQEGPVQIRIVAVEEGAGPRDASGRKEVPCLAYDSSYDLDCDLPEGHEGAHMAMHIFRHSR